MTQEPKKEPVALLIEGLFPDGSLALLPNGLFLEAMPGGTPVYVHRHAAQYKVVEAMKKKGILQDANKKLVEKWRKILPTHKIYEQLAETSRAGFLLYEYANVLFPIQEP